MNLTEQQKQRAKGAYHSKHPKWNPEQRIYAVYEAGLGDAEEIRQSALHEAAAAICPFCQVKEFPLKFDEGWKHANGWFCIAHPIHSLICAIPAAPTPEQQDALPDAGLVERALKEYGDAPRGADERYRMAAAVSLVLAERDAQWERELLAQWPNSRQWILAQMLEIKSRLSRADSERVTPNIQCFEYGDGDGLWCVLVNHDRNHPDSAYGLNERRAKLLAGALKAEMAQSSTR